MATLAEIVHTRKLLKFIPVGDIVAPVENFPKSRQVFVQHRVKRARYELSTSDLEKHQVLIEARGTFQVYVHPCTVPNCDEPNKGEITLTGGEINSSRIAGKVFSWQP